MLFPPLAPNISLRVKPGQPVATLKDVYEDAIEIMRQAIIGFPNRPKGEYGLILRVAIGFLGSALDTRSLDDNISYENRTKLRDSLAEAHAYITGWFRRHGLDDDSIEAMEGTIKEARAARLGWPDETGKGWRPPYETLGMTPPKDA